MPMNDKAVQDGLNLAAAGATSTSFTTIARGLKAAAAGITVLTTPPPVVVLPPPAKVAPAAPPTSFKALLQAGGSIVFSMTTPAGLVSGTDIYMDGVKQSWDRINADGSSVSASVNVMHTMDLVPAGVHKFTASAYNDFGEGPQTEPIVALSPEPSTPTVPPVVAPGTPDFGPFMGTYAWDQTPKVTHDYENNLLGGGKYDWSLVHGDISSWSALLSNWFIGSWRGQGYRMVITFCPFPADGSANLQAAGRGDYRSQWATMLAGIAAAFPDAILRFAHEQNCCYPWKASADPVSYLNMWKIWAPMARQASSKFMLAWNPITGGTFPAEKTYPGRGYVDIAGIDTYNVKGGWPGIVKAGNWGLDQFHAFCKSEGLPEALFEWGNANYPRVPAQDSGDVPAFIQGVWDWKMATRGSDIIYEDTNADVRSALDIFPNSAAVYRNLWGPAARAKTKTLLPASFARKRTLEFTEIDESLASRGRQVSELMAAAK